MSSFFSGGSFFTILIFSKANYDFYKDDRDARFKFYLMHNKLDILKTIKLKQESHFILSTLKIKFLLKQKATQQNENLSRTEIVFSQLSKYDCCEIVLDVPE